MTKKDLLKKLEALGDLDDEARNAIVCSLIGHSRVVHSFFWQITCARCGAILGDTLTGCYDLTNRVVVHHGCDVCRRNWATFSWKDKLYVENPFKEEVKS